MADSRPLVGGDLSGGLGGRGASRPGAFVSPWAPRARKPPSGPPAGGESPMGRGDAYAWSLGQRRRLKITIPFVGFALYTWVAITFQLGLGQPAVLLGLVGLATVAPLRFPRFAGFLAAWVAWSATGLLTTQHADLVGAEVEVLVKVCLIVFLGVNALRSRAQVRMLMALVCLGYGLYPARGTIINFARGYTLNGRALWNYVYENPNDLATISIMAMAVAGALFVTERKGWIRRGAQACLMVLPVLVALTQSRGGFLGMMVFAAIALWGRVRLRRPRFRVILASAAVIVASVVVVPEQAWSRLGQLTDVMAQVSGLGDSGGVTSNLNTLEDQGSAAQRFQVWGIALEIAGDHIVTGIGQGAYAAVHGEYDRAGGPGFGARDAHSTYLAVLAETGIVGLFLFVGMLVSLIMESEKTRKRMLGVMPLHARQLRILQAGIAGFLSAGIFGSYHRVSFLYLLMILIWTVTHQARRELNALAASGHPSPRKNRVRRPMSPV